MKNYIRKSRSTQVSCFALAFASTIVSITALAQQKTGPGLNDEDSLTWHGITLYGVVDLGYQFDTHSAPFTPYRPAASGNIVRSNDYQSASGITPSNMGQSRVGLQGREALTDDLSAVFQIETFFNPQSGEIANSLKSLALNNGKAADDQHIGVDGSSAGQAFQTAYVGLQSTKFGKLTFGRQTTLLNEGTIKYDPNYNATAFGLLGASNSYSGGGTSEENRLDSVLKYSYHYSDFAHVSALLKFNQSNGSAITTYQGNVGAQYAGLSLDAYYSKENDAIVGSALSVAQVATLPALGYSPSNSLMGTVSDNTTYSLMGRYRLNPVTLFAGVMRIRYANPAHPLAAGFEDIGGYVLAVVNNDAFVKLKYNNVFWTGARYSVMPRLDLVGAFYGYNQNAYGTGTAAFCNSTAHSTCRGSFEAFSFDADYHFDAHFDAYAGAMYSGVHSGVASGYFFSTNINPTVGVRYKF